MSDFDALVLGAGAAGLLCAGLASQRGVRVALLEHNREPGRKILISGGGRCNFTNLRTSAANFLSENPHFAKSALARFTPADFLALVERHGIRYHEKTRGQLFCDGSAREIVRMLLAECRGAELVTDCAVTAVGPGFRVETSRGVFTAPQLVVATGGLSIPKLGATGLGYRIARQFGLRVVPPRPALVPLTFAAADLERWRGLAGVSFPAVVAAGDVSFAEKVLFTHRGLSGPAILQASSYWCPGGWIEIDALPGIDFAEELREARASGATLLPKAALAAHLPKRLADRWLAQEDQPVAVLSNAGIARLADALHHWRIIPSGTEGFEKAEVTAGGVSTGELTSRTLEAKRVPGLYFIGEVVDVTGWLGGYNFQWAWASAFAAAQDVQSK
jgi:predicted Rossmann fold flavoprotein